MALGKSIRIFLADGSVAGIRHGEIANWSGQALSCPRARFADLLREWAKEGGRPGVYFLFGVSDETGRDVVYVGEAEVVTDRIASHISGKEFWGELVAFTSKDDNLTKGHVRYLEARALQLITSAGRYALTNNAKPQLPSLPRADRDAMEEFIEHIRTLLGVLGYRALEPLSGPPKLALDVAPIVASAVRLPARMVGRQEPTSFELHSKELKASAIRTDEGVVVIEGSSASLKVSPSLSIAYRSLRDRLIAEGVIKPDGQRYIFSRDHLFSSPSQAAAIIVGYAINGRDAWRTKDGHTWGHDEALAAKALQEELLLLEKDSVATGGP